MLPDTLAQRAADLGLAVAEKKGKYTLTRVVAERKAFLSKKKLTYTAWVKADDTAKVVHFSEMLSESGFGMSSGFDSDMSPGFGFKTEAYSSSTKGRSGSIAEQSTLFGKQYAYDFDYALMRREIEQLAKDAGYAFEYHITPSF